ncbi:hypothetical protein Tco_0159258 [Tanacetum coccineum]
MAFPRLQELAAAEKSNNLTDAMSVFIQRKINDEPQFAAGLSHLWEVIFGLVFYVDGDDDVELHLLWYYVHGDDDIRI